mmetsp:Transcript_39865/g.73849  ORF Transcript_39865/g.73849 Transcript_39865/m.73849 type:complete len:227 (+) Transcript_39865:1-681(+)
MTMGPGAGFEFCLWSAGALSATELMIKATVGAEIAAGECLVVQGVPESLSESPESQSESPDESTPNESQEEGQRMLGFQKARKASQSSMSVSTTDTDRKLLQVARAQHSIVRRVEDPPLSLGVVGSIAGADRHFRRGLLGKREDRTGPHLLFEGDGFQTDFPDNPVTKYLYKSMSSDTLCDMLSPKTPGSARSSQHFSPLVRKSSFMADVLESIPRRGSMRNFLGN